MPGIGTRAGNLRNLCKSGKIGNNHKRLAVNAVAAGAWSMKLKDILDFFVKEDQSPGANPSFIRLVQIMREDRSFRDMVYHLIERPEEEKQALIERLIFDMAKNKAPREHIEVLKILTDPEICQKVIELQRPKKD